MTTRDGDTGVGEIDGIDDAIALVRDRSVAGAAHGRADPVTSLPWPEARARAARAGRLTRGGRSHRVVGEEALGEALAEPLTALTDLPSFDTSAMDGWAVSGPGPWSVVAAESVLAGHAYAGRLPDGTAVRIATGARIPPEATAVIRTEHARLEEARDSAEAREAREAGKARGAREARSTRGTDVAGNTAGDTAGDTGDAPEIAQNAADVRHPRGARGARRAGDTGRLYPERRVTQGQDIRPRGQECRSGDQLLPAGATVTPAVLGLAAAAGYDTLHTVPRPTVEVLVVGDELLSEGLPHEGLIRDALGPMIPPWLRSLGADVLATHRVRDDADALYSAITGSRADLVVTTGGTASGPVDHVHSVLHKAGAKLLVDGVTVRPGHPMLLARLDAGRHLVGLPGNPLAAVSGLLTLAEPLLRELAGRRTPMPYRAPVGDDLRGHPNHTRLVPFVHRADRLEPVHFNGPAMLRGIAIADGLVVVPPGGVTPGTLLEVLDLPWTAPVEGGCFT